MKHVIGLVCLVLQMQNAMGNLITDTTCNKTKTCIFLPDGCSLSQGSCRFVSWAKSSTPNSMDIELSGSKVEGEEHYIAFAFGTMDKMQDADVYFCGQEFKTAVIRNQNHAPVADPGTGKGMGSEFVAVSGGRTQCKFTRPFSVTKMISANQNHDFDVTQNSYYALVAQGKLDDFGDMQYHTWKEISTEKINFTVNFESEVVRTTAPLTTTPNATVQQPENATTTTQITTTSTQQSPTTSTETVDGSPTTVKMAPTTTPSEETTSKAMEPYAELWLLIAAFCTFAQLL